MEEVVALPPLDVLLKFLFVLNGVGGSRYSGVESDEEACPKVASELELLFFFDAIVFGISLFGESCGNSLANLSDSSSRSNSKSAQSWEVDVFPLDGIRCMSQKSMR